MGRRKRISLYIASQLVDLDDQSFILFNYTQEDLSNPTIIKNSFTKQIVLKGSPINNKIFGDLFRMDRKTLYGTKYLGAYFDPARKTPFTIYNEMNEIVESGYVKVDKVTKDGVSIEYHITLYGGLGSFFYGLMYDEDGNKRSLQGMTYKFGDGTSKTSFSKKMNHQQVSAAWSYLSNPSGYNWSSSDFKAWNIINFAPAYNGIPENFSADKGVFSDRYKNIYTTSPTNNSYTYKSGTSSNLVVFGNKHDAWEMRDLRWYLLRPVVRLQSILEAICLPENNGGFNVEIDSSLKSSPMYKDSWVTLPMIPMEDRNKSDVLNGLLASAKSPAEYLVSFAKILGLVFMYDNATKSVKIMPRTKFFSQNDEVIDLTKRINKSTMTIKPILGDTHYYQMGGDAIGEWAAEYKEDYGLDYGIQKINTGNEFNFETKKITEGLTYKDAVDVQERSVLFQSDAYTYGYTDAGEKVWSTHFLLPKFESVKVQLWSGSEMTEVECGFPRLDPVTYNINPEFPLSDWLPKVQLHDKDQKSIDGSDVLLLFNGMKDTPTFEEGRELKYYLTNDTDDMTALNESTPCWNFTNVNSLEYNRLPSFRRCITHVNAGTEYLDQTWEWGTPKARGVNGVAEGTEPTIYNLWWKKYLTDRYDDDTFVLTCKANLGGLNVGQELMGRFFYYDGAIFVLNKINNHSLTTWDDTECEFVKVQDINNYIG